MANIPIPQIIRSHRRTIALQILPDASLIVKAPVHVSMSTINTFISQHTEWIEERLQRLQSRPKAAKRTYTSGDIFLYLGREYRLDVGNHLGIAVKGDTLLFPQGIHFRIQKELTTWYMQQARKIITEQVEYYAKQMSASYTDLTFSDTKSQWGRCTHDNRLQFSWRLVMAPLLTLNYVVVHELTHTTEKNHSRAFWSKVRYFNPTYRQQIKWLKDNGSLLIV